MANSPDVARICRRKENEAGRDLDGLACTFHGRSRTECLDGFLGHGSRAVEVALARHTKTNRSSVKPYINGVQMGPGATALQRIPFSPTIWLLNALMNAIMAPLVAV